QFAITIAISVAISGFVALTLSPALCALILKPRHSSGKGFFAYFNQFFGWAQTRYADAVVTTIARSVLSLALFGIVVFFAVTLFPVTPSGFLPDEDQGYIIMVSLLPDGASKKRTTGVMDKVAGFILSNPAVYGTVELVSQNFVFNTRGTYMAT